MTGPTISHYRIPDKLGDGGMGAIHVVLNRTASLAR